MNTYHILYQGKSTRSLHLRIEPGIPFKTILKTLEQIDFPQTTIRHDHIIYAVLELVNNSLRAHREHEVNEPVHLRFRVDGRALSITIEDRGRGFDPSRLPYDLNEDLSSIDLNNSNFQEYRLQHQYKRFGMGLYVARKTFPTFHLSFIDNRGQERKWDGEETIQGTKIHLSTGAQE
ncbi:MAG: ATP-binding protein [Spirochaetales bacterium]|nr:ATP-binding protein [Spirochaetales bacterium]MCF7937927.1 ATP-binding protein [Spirochaetales bacterium]